MALVLFALMKIPTGRSSALSNSALSSRNRETDLSLPKPNTDSGKRCFKYNGAIVWNNLPYEAKVAGSLSCFQRTINQANT